MSQRIPKLIFGAAAFGDSKADFVRQSTVQDAQAMLDILKKHEIKTIDTSRGYPPGAPGTSEELLGKTDIASWAVIDTKVRSTPGLHKEAEIQASVTGSLEALKIPKVGVEYLHFPDRTVPLEEVVKAMNDAHVAGKFEKFGVSNYSINEVKRMVEICKANNYILPSVYQGHYNPIGRRAEAQLIPFLREHGIAFYSYSPAAGGAFSSKSRLAAKDIIGDMNRQFYGNDGMTAAISKVVSLADSHGFSGHEAALRWVLYHSALDAEKGDAMIIGASSTKQLDDTLTSCASGPLPKDLVDAIEEVWVLAEPDAISYSPWAKDDGSGEPSDFVFRPELVGKA